MSTSKYLPPFTNAERTAVDRAAGSTDSAVAASSVPAPSETDTDATYADFLGDEVDD
jgi:hypothetical protein